MSLYAFFQGAVVPLDEAKLPVMTHAFHYGTACFEGIRANYNEEEGQVYLFRAREHFERLIKSGHIIHVKSSHTANDMVDIARDIIVRDGLRQDMYIRPVLYKSTYHNPSDGEGQQKIAALQEKLDCTRDFARHLLAVANLVAPTLQDEFLMFAVPLGNYLDPSKGIHCGTSSWRRIDDLTIPARAKVTGGYVNSVMARTDARESGFDEAIMLNNDGHVAEGSGENVFVVADGKLVTPAVSDNVLIGITRQTIIELARNELGIETVERQMDRSELYVADEVFLTGTAAHLTPVTRVDHRKVGPGVIGPITQRLQQVYFDVVRGRNKKYLHWCAPVFADSVSAPKARRSVQGAAKV